MSRLASTMLIRASEKVVAITSLRLTPWVSRPDELETCEFVCQLTDGSTLTTGVSVQYRRGERAKLIELLARQSVMRMTPAQEYEASQILRRRVLDRRAKAIESGLGALQRQYGRVPRLERSSMAEVVSDPPVREFEIARHEEAVV